MQVQLQPHGRGRSLPQGLVRCATAVPSTAQALFLTPSLPALGTSSMSQRGLVGSRIGICLAGEDAVCKVRGTVVVLDYLLDLC